MGARRRLFALWIAVRSHFVAEERRREKDALWDFAGWLRTLSSELRFHSQTRPESLIDLYCSTTLEPSLFPAKSTK